mmetsp:Transcript_3416/g.12270  ORF Transcript_3416/g.12270 Transcript_3416/m.12270 type:complete len:208 (-) Transcript_3416:2250-2873(-)
MLTFFPAGARRVPRPRGHDAKGDQDLLQARGQGRAREGGSVLAAVDAVAVASERALLRQRNAGDGFTGGGATADGAVADAVTVVAVGGVWRLSVVTAHASKAASAIASSPRAAAAAARGGARPRAAELLFVVFARGARAARLAREQPRIAHAAHAKDAAFGVARPCAASPAAHHHRRRCELQLPGEAQARRVRVRAGRAPPLSAARD